MKKFPFNTNFSQKVVETRKVYRRTCRVSEGECRRRITEKLLSLENENPKHFWKILKGMQEWGDKTTDPSSSIAAKTWEKYFKKLLKTNGQDHLETETQKAVSTPSTPLSEVEFRNALNCSKPGKSFGPDKLS